ncbi:hypothetical protein LLF88_06275 [bacterium]|nr:hypothetical protein [bacterium]
MSMKIVRVLLWSHSKGARILFWVVVGVLLVGLFLMGQGGIAALLAISAFVVWDMAKRDTLHILILILLGTIIVVAYIVVMTAISR